MKEFILRNQRLEAAFDEYGRLVRLKNRKTGWKIQEREALALSFAMQVPLEGRRNNTVYGSEQQPPELGQPADNVLQFTWKGLKSAYTGLLDIIFTARVTLHMRGLLFESRVENRSPYTVESVEYPCLGAVERPEGAQPFYRMNGAYCRLMKTELAPHFANQMGYWGVDYPTQLAGGPESPFVLVGNEEQGLYVGNHDTTCKELVQFCFVMKPGQEDSLRFTVPAGREADGKPVHMELKVFHFPYAAPGEMVEASPVFAGAYEGNWERGADLYKSWRSTWFKRPPAPSWIKPVHAWLQLHINSPEDELRCRYQDLVRYGRSCAQNGIRAIQLVGWNTGGQDRAYPLHDTDGRLGTAGELRQAIAEIQQMGVKVVLFNKYTWADRSLPQFRTRFLQYAAKDPYGDYRVHPGYQYQTPAQLSDINTRRLVPMCMNSAQWRDFCCGEFEKSIDLGADGILYDECQHHGGAFYCFDPSHGHHVPANIYAGDHLLAQDFRAVAEKKKPDFLFAGEACYDLELRDYALAYFRITPDHIPLQRYLDPYAGLMAAVTGFNDRDAINLCLVYRYIISYEPYMFKGSPEDFPRTVAYGRMVDALRTRYSNLLWDAEFTGTKGLLLESAQKESLHYSVFIEPGTGRRAAAIANTDAERPAEVKARFELQTSNLWFFSPEEPDGKVCGGSRVIPPRSLAVLYEK